MYTCLSYWNAFSCFSVYTNLVSFFVRLVSRIASLEYPSTNFLLQFASPRKAQISLTVFSVSYSSIDYTFFGSILILVVLIINPRNSISFLQNLHFSGTVLKSTILSRSSTAYTSLVYCSRLPRVKIKMLLTYTITVMSSKSRSISLTSC